MKAVWNGAVLAESEDTVVVEGNHYFPPGTVNDEHFGPSDTQTWCPWKGHASYRSVTVDGEAKPDAAWFYPDPKEAAENIRDHVAFADGVEVTG